ncbi:galactokinase [Siculibacillus lacustris]|uniref:Galactokinase n=1 Tax=Siculibacillus lacustris TaxID=1549641 RepID=A0A4Q9VT56_9HYPH|nr:galactokinase [Siculibacillus lacustris]TBW38739.1 galactokinase [Siculibacillus lacustris]
MPDLDLLVRDFVGRYGRRPQIHRAPGRVNLIGEHTDYNDGFVMPAALDFATYAAAAPRSDRILRVHSRARDETRTFDLDDPTPTPVEDWSDYVRGVAVMLERAGHRLTGVDLTLTTTVPMGSGLSSSAALEVSVGHALLAAAGVAIDLTALALTCQRAENEFVGMRCGIMDQFISCRGVADHALMIDCRSLEARAVPIDPRAKIVVVNSMVHHQLAGGGDYNARRRSCEEGVARLQDALGPIRALRDVGPTELEDHAHLLDEVTHRRCRHIVTENERVVAAAEALEVGDLVTFGTLMNASYASMRDDYEISCAEVDVLVDIAQKLPGVLGSRMTGGGFGGCTVSLVETAAVGEFMATVAASYRAATGLDPTVFACSPAAGVGVVEVRS